MNAGQITGLIALAALLAGAGLVELSRRYEQWRDGARAAMARDDVEFERTREHR